MGSGKGEWEGKGKGEVSLQATRDQSGQGLHQTQRLGFQVSERDLGTREGSPGKGEIIKGNYQRDSSRGVCAMCSDIVNLYIHIMLLCLCG